MWIYIPWFTAGDVRWLFWLVVALGVFMGYVLKRLDQRSRD